MKENLERIYRDPFVHVIDDFYDDLGWLSPYLEKANFSKSPSGNYSGTFIPAPPNKSLAQKKIDEFLGVNFIYLQSDGEVRSLLPRDIGEEKTFVHVDDHALVSIVIYLSDCPTHDDPARYGTTFYEHADLRQKMIIPSSPIKYKFQKNILLRDTKELSKWNPWKTVPFKKNRAVIFNSLLYHSTPAESFGNDYLSSRLSQHFFGRIRPGDIKDTWKK